VTIRSRFAHALTLALLLALPVAVSANCGAEGCPMSPHGPEARFGRFGFNVRWQSVDQDHYWDGGHSLTAAQALTAEGGFHHVLEQQTRTRTMLLDASARIVPRLSVLVTVPYVDRVHRHALVHTPTWQVESEWHMKGLGDASALADWDVIEGASGFGTLTVQAGIKLPTGITDVPEVNGDSPEPSARPGSGSTDFLGGLAWRRVVKLRGLHDAADAPITASVSARYNGRGSENFRMGDEWDAAAGLAWPLTHAVHVLAQLDATRHSRDDAGDTDVAPHETGSSAAYASPGLLVAILPGMTAFGYDQLRIYEHTNGPQLVSPYHVSAGLAWSLP
jgi:hypothetical protein